MMLAQLADHNSKENMALSKYLLHNATSARSSEDLSNILKNAADRFIPKMDSWILDGTGLAQKTSMIR